MNKSEQKPATMYMRYIFQRRTPAATWGWRMGEELAQWKQGGKIGSDGNDPGRNSGGRDWKWGSGDAERCVCVLSHFSRVRLFATPWTVAHQAPLSLGFSRQEYWSDCHALLQGIFATQGSNLSFMSPALAGGFFTSSAAWEVC